MQRTRTKMSDAEWSQLHYVRKYVPNGVVTAESYQDEALLGTVATMVDTPHPGYFTRRAAGELIFDAMQLTKTLTEVESGSITWIDGSSSYHYDGDLFTPFVSTNPPPLPNVTAAKDSAVGRAAVSALSKLNLAEVESGENLFELGQTISSLRHPFASACTLISNMERKRARRLARRGRRPSVSDYASITSSTWLEYSFGWRPIVEDISTVMKLYSEKSEVMGKLRHVARGGATYETEVTSTGTTVSSGGIPIGLTVAATWRKSLLFKAATGVIYELPYHSDSSFYTKHLGLGANALPSTGWNMLPFSWVVDQVINVGDWVKAAFPDPDIVIIQKWLTTISEITDYGTATDCKIWRKPDGEPARWFTGSAGAKAITHTDVKRVLDFSLPSYPIYNPNMSYLSQALNDAAAGIQLVTNLLKRWLH